MPRLTRLLPALLLAALAACGGDEPARDAGTSAGPAAPAAVEPVPEEVRLTPAESAAAVAQVRERGEAATRRVRARTRELDPPPPAAAHVETTETAYESCVSQARSVDGPERARLMEICERRRDGP